MWHLQKFSQAVPTTIALNSFLCICVVTVQVTGKIQGGMASTAASLCQKSDWDPGVHQGAYSLKGSDPKS